MLPARSLPLVQLASLTRNDLWGPVLTQLPSWHMFCSSERSVDSLALEMKCQLFHGISGDSPFSLSLFIYFSSAVYIQYYSVLISDVQQSA